MFAKEVMPEFHEADTAHQHSKEKVPAQEIVEELDTAPYDLNSYQNEDIVRLSPKQLKRLL